MTFTYDPTTDLGRVRLLIPDTESTDAYFEDAEITAFLSLNDGDVRLAAAQALDTLASSNALILKVITQNGVSTNGAAVATALRAQAAELRRQAETGGLGDDAEDATWDWAETVGTSDPFAYRERLVSQALRGGS